MNLDKWPIRNALGAWVAVVALGWCPPVSGQAQAPEKDPLKLSFLFMGCNRIQEGDWEKIKDQDPSAANLPQLQRTAQDIVLLSPTPPYLFFTGDLVLNLEDDKGEALKAQLDAWTRLYKGSPQPGADSAPGGKGGALSIKLTLIPLPGNHEMLRKVDKEAPGPAKAAKKADEEDDEEEEDVEVPNPFAGPTWVDWLHRSGFDTFAKVANGPRKDHPKADRLADDQRELTYSFNIGDVHFVVVNTDTLSEVIDPETKQPYAGWIPYHWIEADIVAAQANPAISAIFVLGHKPIQTPKDAEEDEVLDTPAYPLATKLRKLLLANHKVRAYLCAHEHLWECSPLDKSQRVWQVVAGNAGSQLTKTFRDGSPFFGFSQINIYTSGKVGLVSYQREASSKKTHYISGPPSPPPPAVPQKEIILHPSP